MNPKLTIKISDVHESSWLSRLYGRTTGLNLFIINHYPGKSLLNVRVWKAGEDMSSFAPVDLNIPTPDNFVYNQGEVIKLTSDLFNWI